MNANLNGPDAPLPRQADDDLDGPPISLGGDGDAMPHRLGALQSLLDPKDRGVRPRDKLQRRTGARWPGMTTPFTWASRAVVRNSTGASTSSLIL